MANKIVFIDTGSKDSDALKAYMENRPDTQIVSSDSTDLNDRLDSSAWHILVTDPLSCKGLSDRLITAKKANFRSQLILYAPENELEYAMDLFSSQAFTFFKAPVSPRMMDLAIIRAGEKIDLEKENQQLNRLFDEVPCYISVQDAGLKITRANKRFNSHFGDHIGEYCYKVYKDRTSPCPDCPVALTFKDGQSHKTEETVIARSGRPAEVLTKTAPVRDETGEIRQVMQMSINITQIRRLQNHLASLGLMLGSMFHGVKGTITALDGGIYQLERGLDESNYEKVVQAGDQIKTMAGKIKKMVVEILDYARSKELRYQRVGLAEFIQSVEETSRPVADKAGVSFIVKTHTDPGFIDADAGWLEAAFVNFLENAVEACLEQPDQSNPEVRFEVERLDRDQVCFIVVDNGAGMTKTVKDNLFTLFYTSKGVKGTGLGMFIANRVIRHHGGRVEFQSEPGRGTEFRIYLPGRRPSGSVLDKALGLTQNLDLLDPDHGGQP